MAGIRHVMIDEDHGLYIIPDKVTYIRWMQTGPNHTFVRIGLVGGDYIDTRGTTTIEAIQAAICGDGETEIARD